MYGEGSVENASPCAGCLVTGRRLRDISDYWKRSYYVQILSEIPASRPEGAPLYLCWECNARLSAAVNFREQVKTCYTSLCHYGQKDSPGGDVMMTRLDVGPVHAESIEPCTLHEDGGIPVKTEETWLSLDSKNEDKDDILKYEMPAASPGCSFTLSDDEQLTYLVDVAKDEPKKRDRRTPQDKDGARARGKRRRAKRKFDVVRLSWEELAAERRLLERSERFQSAEYKCDKCLVTFVDEERARQHEKAKHSAEQGVLRCATCDCAFASDSALRCHAARHLRRYRCPACPETLASRRLAARHQLLHREEVDGEKGAEGAAGENALEKEEDGEESSSCVQRETHTTESEAGRERAPASAYPCDKCAKVFRWKTSLRKHAELHRIQAGEKKPPYCEPCRLSFTTTANLQKHVKTSSKHQIQLKLRSLKELLKDSPEELKLAPIEEVKTSVRNALNKFACPHCDHKFQWKGNLLRHIQSHKARANGELYCAPCDRRFSSLATYQQHMKISKKHVSENDFRYMCSECGRKFANKTRLKDHVDWEHLKVYAHKCPLCQKVFKSNTSLYLHKQVVHRKDNGDHLCDHCGKPFPNRAKLRSHITAMHTSEQPYKCKLCTASFSWHSCLSRHVKVVHHKIKTKRKRKKAEMPMPQTILAPAAASS